MRIIFMGTPEFAVPTLAAIHESDQEVVGVVTAPDKPAGRGRKLQSSAVKKYADEQGIPVFQPVKLRNPEFVEAMKALNAELMVVVAFRMLPQMIWEIPSIGTFNLHAALLPDYRGAAPINWVVMNGERQTGMTTFFIDKQIDTGNILLQESMEIPVDWTAGNLHDEMMVKGAGLVMKTIMGLEAGELTPRQQDDSLFQHHAPKIFKEDCRIKWDQPAETIYNFVRGLSPFPTAWTTLEDQNVKIFFTKLSELEEDGEPGQLLLKDNALFVKVANGWLEITELQLAGRKRMQTKVWLQGIREIPTHFS
ncbi:MAG: methionyl-tRNA formyltransferase [Bacteroidota bacterium]